MIEARRYCKRSKVLNTQSELWLGKTHMTCTELLARGGKDEFAIYLTYYTIVHHKQCV